MPELNAKEGILTGKTILGMIAGVIIGFLVLPIFWAPLLNLLKGFEWAVAIISFGIFLLGYMLIKYAEGAPDVLGAIILMIGYTLLVFSIWYWMPILALQIPLPIYKDYITVGLIVGSIAFLIGIILIKKYEVQEKHLNDLGEILGLMYGGLMLYVWFTDIIMIPLLQSLGINLLAQIDPWYFLAPPI
ncbi:MAG: hypothetical protein ACTSRG_06200 [Candidatus Helarchaeota archaeon]